MPSPLLRCLPQHQILLLAYRHLLLQHNNHHYHHRVVLVAATVCIVVYHLYIHNNIQDNRHFHLQEYILTPLQCLPGDQEVLDQEEIILKCMAPQHQVECQ